MRSAENIEKLVKNLDLEIDTNKKKDRIILGELLETQKRSEETKSAFALPEIWRQIMKSPITKLATAAVIIIALFVGINHFGGSVESVAWADVAERFESVPFFNVTIYLGWGPYEQDQKLEFRKMEIWTSENSQLRAHSEKEVIFADFADGNNVVVAFDRSTMRPLNADRMAKLANSFHGFLRPKGEFSIDNLLPGFSSDDTGITPVDTADTAASRETVLFETKQRSIWALRKSKLPMRMSFRDTKHKIYGDFLFNYSEKKDVKFFDPNAFTGQ